MKGLQDELGGSTGDPSGGCMDPKDDDSLYIMSHLREGSWVLAGSQTNERKELWDKVDYGTLVVG